MKEHGEDDESASFSTTEFSITVHLHNGVVDRIIYKPKQSMFVMQSEAEMLLRENHPGSGWEKINPHKYVSADGKCRADNDGVLAIWETASSADDTAEVGGTASGLAGS